MTLDSALGCGSLQEQGGSADVSEADGDTMDAMEFYWSMSGEFTYRHHVMPREHLYVPKDSSFPIVSKFTDLVRQKKTNLDKLENSIIDDAGNIY